MSGFKRPFCNALVSTALAVQCGAGGSDLVRPLMISREAIVADLHEARRQDVQAEPPEELDRAQGHLLLPMLIAVILVPEGHRLACEIESS